MKNAKAYITGAGISIFIVLVCALTLRLYNLNKYDLWFDEQNTDMFASEILTQAADLSGVSPSSLMLVNMKSDPHSSLYYLLIYAYSALFGGGKSLRVLSVIFSMLSLGLFYKFSRLFFNRRTGVYALLIMALNPFHVWYAQEARVYAVACFFSLLLVYIYMQALKTGRLFYWICFPVVSIFAVCFSYFSGLLLAISGTALFFKNNRKYVGKWILSLCVILIFFMVFQRILIAQLNFVKDGFWLPSPTWTTFLFTWKIFTLGYSATNAQHQVGLAFFFILFGYGAYSYYRSNKANAIMLFLFLFLPILATYIFSKLFSSVYIHRQLIIFSPFYYLFIAKGIESIGSKRIQILSIICAVALMTGSLVNYYYGYMFPYRRRTNIFLGVFSKKNYGDLMEYLNKEYRRGDLIATADIQSHRMVSSNIIKHYKQYGYVPSKMFCYLFYPNLLRPYVAQYLKISGLADQLSLDDRKKLHAFSFFQRGRPKMDEIQLNEKVFKRIWLITSNWERGASLSEDAYLVRKHMLENFEKISSKENDGINVELYTWSAP